VIAYWQKSLALDGVAVLLKPIAIPLSEKNSES